VTSGSDDSSNLGLFGASLGFVVLLGARRRRSSK
jgi:LPXTG-motif cell wall-anchored protein